MYYPHAINIRRIILANNHTTIIHIIPLNAISIITTIIRTLLNG